MRRLNRAKVNKVLITVMVVLMVIMLLSVGLFILVLRSTGVDSMDRFARAMDMLVSGETISFDETGETGNAVNYSRVDYDRDKTPATSTPTMLVMSLDPETGKLDRIFIEIFRTADAAIDLIHIPTDVAYLMSSSLYAELTVGNPKLSQSITMSELYNYYHSDACFDAARRIVSEMTNFNILYFTVLYSDDLKHYVEVYSRPDGYDMSLAFDSEIAMSERYGTPGSAEGFISHVLGNAKTNRPIEERLLFMDVYDRMNDESVTFLDAPVITFNESKEVDRNAMARLIYSIIY